MSSTKTLSGRLKTTLGKELIVGVTGVLLVGFIIGHLAGNLLLLVGPEAFNDYAEKLHSLGEFIWAVHIGLIVIFLAHVTSAISLARANAKTRGAQRYEVEKSVGRKSAPTRLMLISGVTILAFTLYHVYDFTLTGDWAGDRSFVDGMGEESLGLYGVVFSSFTNPLRALFYIIAVCGVGLHLSHAVASVVVTLGVLDEKNTTKAELAAKVLGAVIAVGFSSIPLYVLLKFYVIGVSPHA